MTYSLNVLILKAVRAIFRSKKRRGNCAASSDSVSCAAGQWTLAHCDLRSVRVAYLSVFVSVSVSDCLCSLQALTFETLDLETGIVAPTMSNWGQPHFREATEGRRNPTHHFGANPVCSPSAVSLFIPSPPFSHAHSPVSQEVAATTIRGLIPSTYIS